jgi:hypothetical protein
VCIILRALATIDEFGQPRSMGYLPSSVFDPSRMETAANIFVIVTAFSIVSVCMPAFSRREVQSLPALPKWTLWAMGIYFVALAIGSRTVFSTGYATEAQKVFYVPQGGVMPCLQGLVVYELYRRVHLEKYSTVRAFVVLFMLLLVTDYSKGLTGSATGLVFVTAFLLLGRGGNPWTRPLKLGTVLVVAGLFAMVIRQSRGIMHLEGSAAVAAASDQIVSAEVNRASSAEGLETLTNGEQYACHILECVMLYDWGYGRQWRSFYLPIVYTFQPLFIMDWMGWERELDATWELARHFIHGGGIAIFGEMYWNGGYLCVVIATFVSIALAYLADTRRDASFGWLIFHIMYAQTLLQGVGYGINYLFRGSINALLMIAAYKLLAKWDARKASHGPEIIRAPARMEAVLPGTPPLT